MIVCSLHVLMSSPSHIYSFIRQIRCSAESRSLLSSSTYNMSPDSDPVPSWRSQSAVIAPHIIKFARLCAARKESLIVEGVHVTLDLIKAMMEHNVSQPGTDAADSSVVIPFVVYISNEEKHRERFAVRAKVCPLFIDDPHSHHRVSSETCLYARGLSIAREGADVCVYVCVHALPYMYTCVHVCVRILLDCVQYMAVEPSTNRYIAHFQKIRKIQHQVGIQTHTCNAQICDTILYYARKLQCESYALTRECVIVVALHVSDIIWYELVRCSCVATRRHRQFQLSTIRTWIAHFLRSMRPSSM